MKLESEEIVAKYIPDTILESVTLGKTISE